jgi:hypothetical protein
MAQDKRNSPMTLENPPDNSLTTWRVPLVYCGVASI